MNNLTKNEENLLISIYKLKKDAYGVSIRKFLLETTDKNWNYGTLYSSLDQLVKKDMVTKDESDPTPERGGRRKIFYTITPAGIDALKTNYIQHSRIWQNLGEELLAGSGK